MEADIPRNSSIVPPAFVGLAARPRAATLLQAKLAAAVLLAFGCGARAGGTGSAGCAGRRAPSRVPFGRHIVPVRYAALGARLRQKRGD